MADMIEILKSPENLRNICISLSASLCLYAIIIHSSKGRISRIEFWKLKAVQFASLAVAFLTTVLFMTKKLPLVLLFSVPIMLFFAIKSLQASVRRLHDLGFSGWFLLLDFVPIANLVFMLWRVFGNSSSEGLNEYDVPIKYNSFINWNSLYPRINCLELNETGFKVNGIEFEWKKNKGQELCECSILYLEQDKVVQRFCDDCLQRTENTPSYAEKYRVSYKREGDVIGSIISKLNAFVVRNGSLLLDGKEIFVRSDGFSYRLVYDRNAHVPGLEIQERDCLAREYYNIPVSRSQLKKLLETSAGRPLVISPAR